MPENRSRKQSSQWAAQFLVAAEMERHGYNVAFTMGDTTPVADMMVGHPATGDQFWVDVKGLRSKNSWWGRKKEQRSNLFYVLVLVGLHRNQDRFFVLSQREFNTLADEYKAAHPSSLGGFGWNEPLQFEGQWGKLPSWGYEAVRH